MIRIILTLLILFTLFIPTHAQTVVLRDLKRIEAKIAEFNIDGVKLSDGRLITWDRVHDAELPADKKSEFQKFKFEIGLPLLRIKRRLTNHDDSNLLDVSKALAAKLDGRNTQSEYIANCGLFFGYLSENQREQACLALLQCWRISQNTSVDTQVGNRSLDLKSVAIDHLLPIWFDPESANTVWEEIAKSKSISRDSPLGARIYAISLAVAAGKSNEVSHWMDLVDYRQSPWSKIVQAQQLIAEREFVRVSQILPDESEKIEPPMRCVVLYYKGLAGLNLTSRTDQQAALLDLLLVPAEMGDQYPEVAAACLYHVIGSSLMESKTSSIDSLERELFEKYTHTYYARKLRAVSKPAQ